MSFPDNGIPGAASSPFKPSQQHVDRGSSDAHPAEVDRLASGGLAANYLAAGGVAPDPRIAARSYGVSDGRTVYWNGIVNAIDHPQARLALVFGIVGCLGLLFFPLFFASPIAWAIGSSARRAVRENPATYRSGGSLTVGWVLGIGGTVLLILETLLLLALILMYALGASAAYR